MQAPWEGHIPLFLPPLTWKQKWGEQNIAFAADKRKTLKEKRSRGEKPPRITVPAC